MFGAMLLSLGSDGLGVKIDVLLIKWPGLGQAEPKFKIKFFFFDKPGHLFFF